MPAGQDYDIGGFCRIFRRPDGTGYDYFYGGSFHKGDVMRYNGDVWRRMNPDFSFATAPVLISASGGDLAIDSDGKFYYLLNGGPQGWRLRKYNQQFNIIAETDIALPPKHFANDQMVRVHNGLVFVSGLYDPNVSVSQAGKQPADRNQDQFTRGSMTPISITSRTSFLTITPTSTAAR